MQDTCTSHFEPLKFDWVGRRGQKQPKLGIFEGTSILALEPQFHEDWCKNGHATKRKSQNLKMDPKKRFFLKNPQEF